MLLPTVPAGTGLRSQLEIYYCYLMNHHRSQQAATVAIIIGGKMT